MTEWTACAHELQVQYKAKRRRLKPNPVPLAAPNALDRFCSTDFMNHSLHNKVRLRTFNVIDDFNREVLGFDAAPSMPPLMVVRYLDQLADWQGYPEKIQVDNRSEFTSDCLWIEQRHMIVG